MSDQNNPSTQEIQLIEESKRLSKKLLERPKGPQRYITEKEIGRGAMGIINKVYDQDLMRITAMKIIQPQIVDMYSRFNAFVSEARLTAELEHPNIVPIHQLGIIDDTGSPFYTMKLVDGEPLHEIIEKLGVCNAIAYAHSHMVIHRDIKPENIMIGQFGEVLVMDWGLAKKLGDNDGDISDAKREISDTRNMLKTQDGMIKGSPAYISPEQAYGEI